MPEGAGVVQVELVHALHQAVGGLLGGDVPGVAGHVGLHIARVQNGHGDALVLQVHGEGFAGGVEPDEPDRVWHNNKLGGNSTLNTLFGGIVEWHPGPVDLKFIYSENDADVDEAHYDLDSTEQSQAYFYSADQFNYQKTYELQVLSNEDTWLGDKLEWVAGLYRLEGEGGFGSLYLTLNAAGFGSNVIGLPDLLSPILGPIINNTPDIVLGNGGILTTDSNSAFAQATWHTTNWMDVTAGVRYQEEVRGITNSYLDVVCDLTIINDITRIRFKDFTCCGFSNRDKGEGLFQVIMRPFVAK